MFTIFKIIKPGLFTTIQDQGRTGYQKFGLAVSGSADYYAHRMANLLVGNHQSSAVVEVTLLGLRMKALSDHVIAVTGGDLDFRINNVPAPMWTSLKVNEGDVVDFLHCKSGCRAYIGITGGIAVPEVLGSRSTDPIGKIGGIEGRPFQKGDVIPVDEQRSYQFPGIRRRLPEQLIPRYEEEIRVRVVLGPQEDAFTEEGLDVFLTSEYRVSKDIDRMACRLEGPEIGHIDGADITSEGIFTGAIQIPRNGRPIVFLVGRQSIGGYTKIGGVITVDQPKLAQAKPGDRITFEKVTIDEAHVLMKEQEKTFSILETGMHGHAMGV